MGAFLRDLFPRHFLQVQDCLASVTDRLLPQRLGSVSDVNIIDLGSGPAVASLAITSLVSQCLAARGLGQFAKVNYILNDTSSVCLEAGERMLRSYFRRERFSYRAHGLPASLGEVSLLREPFPKSLRSIHEKCAEGFHYTFLVAGYLLAPLDQNLDLSRSANSLLALRQFVNKSGGCTLVLQDKYHEEQIRQFGALLGASVRKERSSQKAYSSTESRSSATYAYFRALSIE